MYLRNLKIIYTSNWFSNKSIKWEIKSYFGTRLKDADDDQNAINILMRPSFHSKKFKVQLNKQYKYFSGLLYSQKLE